MLPRSGKVRRDEDARYQISWDKLIKKRESVEAVKPPPAVAYLSIEEAARRLGWKRIRMENWLKKHPDWLEELRPNKDGGVYQMVLKIKVQERLNWRAKGKNAKGKNAKRS